MRKELKLSENLLQQVQSKGIDPDQVKEQLSRFERGFPDLKVNRPATIGDGIFQVSEDEEFVLAERFKQAQKEGRVMKFVPASGAATRMFKSLQNIRNSESKLTLEFFKSNPEDDEVASTRTFLDNLETFAFFEDLKNILSGHGMDPVKLRNNGDFKTLLSYIMDDKGLGLASLPKALIPFHRYPDHRRAPLEEHLAEAVAYTKNKNHSLRIHFTISPEHEGPFHKRLEQVRKRFESDGTTLLVETSFQKPKTDTIAVDTNNHPFYDENGYAIFRPGGHGALLANLQELKGDIIFIKNIDNVVPDRLKETTYRYKKVLGGYLLTIQDQIFSFLKELDRGSIHDTLRNEIMQFIKQKLFIQPPDTINIEQDDPKKIDKWLFDRLNRPIRVCGMVKNEGEPGGGPFIVESPDGTLTLQIVESAQINLDDPRQKKIFESSTHFNSVDLACAVRDFQGQPFDLESFRDPETGFISSKSYQGKPLKALELPGLWNGSMALWNTIFVEVPAETFTPVKTVNDLLRDVHRNE